MKVMIPIVVTCIAACTSSDAAKFVTPQKIDLKDEVPVYKGVSHYLWQGNYDAYFSQNSHLCGGRFGKYDTMLLNGAWYITSRSESHFNVKIDNPQKTKITDAIKIFAEYIPDLAATRITNYKGMITVLDHNNQITLGPLETILIDEKGKYQEYNYNPYAEADTTWLTSSLIELYPVNLPTLITRIADRYGCTVRFNRSYDALLLDGNFKGVYSCTNNLESGLSMLQSLADDCLKFSYSIKDRIVYIDKYKQ